MLSFKGSCDTGGSGNEKIEVLHLRRQTKSKLCKHNKKKGNTPAEHSFDAEEVQKNVQIRLKRHFDTLLKKTQAGGRRK